MSKVKLLLDVVEDKSPVIRPRMTQAFFTAPGADTGAGRRPSHSGAAPLRRL